MFFADEITLKRIILSTVGGFTVETEDIPLRLNCWAEKKSVTRSEYYAALAVSVQADALFEVSALDYNGHTHLQHGEQLYKIQRAYQTGDTVELTCTREG